MAEVTGGGQFLAVSKDGTEAGRHNPRRCLASDERTRDAIFLQRAVQPVGDFAVLVAIAEEGPVAWGAVRLSAAARAGGSLTRK